MKHILRRQIGALLLVAALLLTPLSAVSAAPEQPSARLSPEELLLTPDAPITRAQFVMLTNSAFQITGDFDEENFLDVPDSHPYAADMLCAKVIGYIAGDGKGYATPDAIISGAEAAVIVNNLLGFDGALVKQADVSVPRWAAPSASVLIDLTMAEAAQIEKRQLTVGDAVQFISALSIASMFQGGPYALSQANLKDDFYAYINRQFLATAMIPPGYMIASPFADTGLAVQMQLQEILGGILAVTSWEQGTDEWIISELYKMHLDNAARTASLSKVKPYLDKINAAASIDELIALSKEYAKYFTLQPYYTLNIDRNAKIDATKWCALVLPGSPDLGSKDYYAEDESFAGIQAAYKEYLASLLEYMGETSDIPARVEALYAIEKGRVDKMLPHEAYADPYLIYTETTWSKMLEMTGVTQSLRTLDEVYQIAKDMPIYCPEPDYVKYIESLYTQENLRALKDTAMLSVLMSISSMLGDDLEALSDGLVMAMMGDIGEKQSTEMRAQDFVTSIMSQAFSRIYADKYSSEEIKKDVTGMVEDMRAKYRERIMSLSWMSAKTKTAAVEKLNAIRALVAYSDEPVAGGIPRDAWSKDSFGSLVEVFFSIADAQHDEMLSMIKKPAEINLWEAVPTSTVNAFYSPTDNTIIIPAGILQGAFYDPKAPHEWNMGAIGAIIAHEFTHAFDNSGAQYDKNGTLTDWWIAEDYAAFGAMTSSMEEALSAIVLMDDINVNGAFAKGEAIADLGAISCVLDILGDKPGADLTKAMEAWASIWALRASPEVAMLLHYTAPYPPYRDRVNFTLSQMDDFYTVYGISEGNGMFIPKEARLSIW